MPHAATRTLLEPPLSPKAVEPSNIEASVSEPN